MSAVELLEFDPARDAELLATWLRKLAFPAGGATRNAALGSDGVPAGGGDALTAVGGAPVGYVRWQVISRSELEAAGITDVPEGSVDIDIAIGDEELVGRGIGRAALVLAIAEIRRAGPPR